MNEMDNMWAQFFQDEPVDEASLRNLKTEVMEQILAHPMDFRSEIQMAQRRKWGFILLAVLLASGIGVFGLIWFEGEWLLGIIGYAPGWLMEKGRLLNQLIRGLKILWQQYLWTFLGISFVWVLFEEIRHKMLVED